MAETCGWKDCRSSEVQPHHVTRQCLTCGRHCDLRGNPVVWVGKEGDRHWELARDHPTHPHHRTAEYAWPS